MPLSPEQMQDIESVIRDSIRRKLGHYRPETKQMPFHYRLLGRDRMALFSFIHSLNTTFGTSIFEPVAAQLAKGRFQNVCTQVDVGNLIAVEAQREIQRIMDELSSGKNPDKQTEIAQIRKVCQGERKTKTKTVKADLYLQEQDGTVHLFDLKTAKPNISNFRDFKRTLLEWVAIYLTQNPSAEVESYIAIPYNPYEPRPYERWTLKGMLDLDHELKVGKEFWDFLGGEGAYEDLLECFQAAGISLRPELDAYFSRFNH
ncbi:MAG: TdeIII family type II restriction endonuclease [Chloroflexota bacterium]